MSRVCREDLSRGDARVEEADWCAREGFTLIPVQAESLADLVFFWFT